MKKIKNIWKFLTIGVAISGLVTIPVVSSVACSSNSNTTNNKPSGNNNTGNNPGSNNNSGNNNIPGNNNSSNNKPNKPLNKPRKLINYTSNEFLSSEDINYINNQRNNTSNHQLLTFIPNTLFVDDNYDGDQIEIYKRENKSYKEQIALQLINNEIFMADRIFPDCNEHLKPEEEQHFIQRAVIYKLSINIKEFALYMTNCFGNDAWLNNETLLNVWKWVPEMNFEIYFYNIFGMYWPHLGSENLCFDLQTNTSCGHLEYNTICYGPNPNEVDNFYGNFNPICQKFQDVVFPILQPFLKNNSSINYNYAWWDNKNGNGYECEYSGPFNNYYYGFRFRGDRKYDTFGICTDTICFQPDQQNQISWYNYDNNNTDWKNALKLDVDLFDYYNYRNIRNFYSFEEYNGYTYGLENYQTYIIDYYNNRNLNTWSITPFKFLEVEISPNEPAKVITDYTF